MYGNIVSIENGSEHFHSTTNLRKLTILKLSAPRPIESPKVIKTRRVNIEFPTSPQKLRYLKIWPLFGIMIEVMTKTS